MSKHWTGSLALVGTLAITSAVAAERQYGPGVSDTDIKIGQTSAYSGPAAAYGNLLSKTQVAYVRMINEHGGINGRKIRSFPSTTATARRRLSSRPAGSWNETTS
jgi:ABC-type branched-subunit amino acid transport system substrate-binding protein